MKKKIVLAASVVAITAGSLFAFSGNDSRATATRTPECSPECCIGPEECEISCDEESSCCMMQE